MWQVLRLGWGLLAAVAVLCAQDARRILPIGSTKDEVLEAYGWPSGQSKHGTREIFTYPQGQIVLEDGKVDRINFSMKEPWPAPRPRPDFSAQPATKEVERALARYDDARTAAVARAVRIVALFSGPDATPAEVRFDNEVARHPEFLDAMAPNYVMLHVDLSAAGALAAELREQAEALCRRLEVKAFPALLLLAPDGAMLQRIDLTKAPAGSGFRAWVIAAVLAAETEIDRPTGVAPGATASKARTVSRKAAAPADTVSAKSSALFSWLFSTRSVVAGALALGVVVVAVLLWLVWRNWVVAPRPAAEGEMTQRISDAASGLPSQLEWVTWPRARVVKLMAAFVEAEGYRAEVMPAGSDKDIVLRRAGGGRAQTIILCAGSEAGEVSVKQVREFFATMTAEAVDHGWYAAPAGFSAEAKAFADQQKIQLFDGPVLTAQLRELPPLVLPKVLAKAAGK